MTFKVSDSTIFVIKTATKFSARRFYMYESELG